MARGFLLAGKRIIRHGRLHALFRPFAGVERRWLRILLRIGLALCLAPVALTFLYAPNFVHPVSTLMLRDLVMLRGYDRQWVRLENVAPVMVHSVIMSEDGQFCAHHGIDFGALNQVIDDAMDGEATRGASTISMQTVKNLYLWPWRSVIRKLAELPVALMFDAILTKRRVMEIYLNIAEWGPGIYGIEAAARHHFGRSAKNLNARQAALLAVTLPNPILRNPAKPSSGLKRLAAVVERRARQAGGYVGCVK